MTTQQDTVSVLPRHPAHSANNDFIYMTLPLIAMATYLYGVRTLGLCVIAVLTANLCDRLVAVLRRRPYDKTENSSISTALIVTLLMPASISYYILIVTVIITVILGKAVFGGWGAYPFTPAAVGFAAAALSWPGEVLQYPEPFAPLTLFGTEGVTLQQSAAHTLAAGGLPNISVFNLLLGNYAGGMGTTAALITVACAAYLWMRKRITLAAPLGFLGTCAAIAYFFPRLGGIGLAWPWQFVRFRLLIVTYEILSGALLYAAVFLLNDETTLPKRQDARFLYGIVAGVGTMVFRYYGSFDMGVCFALLWTNVLSGPLDRWMSALAQSRANGTVRVHLGRGAKAEKPALAEGAPPPAQDEKRAKTGKNENAESARRADAKKTAQAETAAQGGKMPRTQETAQSGKTTHAQETAQSGKAPQAQQTAQSEQPAQAVAAASPAGTPPQRAAVPNQSARTGHPAPHSSVQAQSGASAQPGTPHARTRPIAAQSQPPHAQSTAAQPQPNASAPRSETTAHNAASPQSPNSVQGDGAGRGTSAPAQHRPAPIQWSKAPEETMRDNPAADTTPGEKEVRP